MLTRDNFTGCKVYFFVPVIGLSFMKKNDIIFKVLYLVLCMKQVIDLKFSGDAYEVSPPIYYSIEKRMKWSQRNWWSISCKVPQLLISRK